MRPKNGSALEHAKKEMKEAFGFVPGFYEAVPEVARADAWGVQRDLELSDTALDHKTKELIGLAISAHIKCKYCIHFHTEAARAFGATDQEIREANAMGGMTVMMSNAITGSQVDFDKFRQEVDRGIAHMTSKGGKKSTKAKSGKSASRR